MKKNTGLTLLAFVYFYSSFFLYAVVAQDHPRIYITNDAKSDFLNRIETHANVSEYIADIHSSVDEYVDRHLTDPEWIISRLQMYWKTKYKKIYVKGMDFSHGAGSAPVPTVRFSGSRDWDTDYMVPSLEDIMPYMDDERGLYLQNSKKPGGPWEWVHPSETGHVVENINENILELAEEAAFLYWLNGKEKYAVFATDILMKYIAGMYHRDPPLTVNGHHNKDLMGLQTFEVIHERVVVPLTMSYDFLFAYLKKERKDLKMIQQVFRKWADQEIKYGVPGNNWNLMQARYITYLALALENDKNYSDGKGQQYYIDQVLNQNSRKQKALKDVIDIFDHETGIWPEVASYSIMVSDDILEIYCLMDKTLNNNLLEQYPMLEKAILANFNYLFPNGYTTAYGDAKHSHLRFSALELLISNYRKYNKPEKEKLITSQLKRFIEDGDYDREKIKSLFQLFYYVEKLEDVPIANSFSEMVNPTFYSPNVSWTVQRNGNSVNNGMMISKNASLGNHSHANGINIELFAKGMVIATDCARGDSYWSPNHREYYSRFPAHNTVIVDGISDYKTMHSTHAFSLKSIYPFTSNSSILLGGFTFSDVSFTEPATDAIQQRLTGTIRTSETSGYFVDIFRSARKDKKDKKHEYLFHGQGKGITLSDYNYKTLPTLRSQELASEHGDLVGYDYFNNKKEVTHSDHFIAEYSMPSFQSDNLKVKLYMKGYENRKVFTVDAPYSRADKKEDIPASLYHKPIPTLVVRQLGEAQSRPFVSIIDVFNEEESEKILNVEYFESNKKDPDFIGVKVTSTNGRTDYIYNDQKTAKDHQFKSGAFKGSYGITSFHNKELTSIFLGNGIALSRDLWSISSSQNEGGIMIEINKNELIINAEKLFQLTIPADYLKGITTLESIDSSGGKIYYNGTLHTERGSKIVVFELPRMKNEILKIDN
ncbi:MAG: hypothetical protein ACI9FN_004032 [Saprospiraceae bacterium]|jgi:hypothetical protein